MMLPALIPHGTLYVMWSCAKLLAIVVAAYGLWYGLFTKEFRAVHPWTGKTKYRYKPSPSSALWS